MIWVHYVCSCLSVCKLYLTLLDFDVLMLYYLKLILISEGTLKVLKFQTFAGVPLKFKLNGPFVDRCLRGAHWAVSELWKTMVIQFSSDLP